MISSSSLADATDEMPTARAATAVAVQTESFMSFLPPYLVVVSGRTTG